MLSILKMNDTVSVLLNLRWFIKGTDTNKYNISVILIDRSFWISATLIINGLRACHFDFLEYTALCTNRNLITILTITCKDYFILITNRFPVGKFIDYFYGYILLSDVYNSVFQFCLDCWLMSVLRDLLGCSCSGSDGEITIQMGILKRNNKISLN